MHAQRYTRGVCVCTLLKENKHLNIGRRLKGSFILVGEFGMMGKNEVLKRASHISSERIKLVGEDAYRQINVCKISNEASKVLTNT